MQNADQSPKERMLTVKEASEKTGLSQRQLYYLMEKGVLAYYIIPGVRKRFFKACSLENLFEQAA